MAHPFPTRLVSARTHNLAGVSLELQPGQVVALTGVSGAGKSSLALDTLYAEGQRRFIESFSPYARQFLERLQRPAVDSLDPVAAAVAVDRQAPIKSSRSTVATMADLEPYLAALFRAEAIPFCPDHGTAAIRLDVASAAARVVESFGESTALVTYPIAAASAEEYLEVRDHLARGGYRRVWLTGKVHDIDQVRPSEVLSSPGDFEVILDRLRVSDREQPRLASAIEQGWRQARGTARVRSEQMLTELHEGLSCPVCARRFAPAEPGLFSYESPVGACPRCRGFGRTIGVDLTKVIPDEGRSLSRGAVRPWRGASTRWERGQLKKLCQRHSIPWDAPWSRLSQAQQRWIIDGDGDWDDGFFPGVLGWFRWLESRTYKLHVRVLLARYRSYDRCLACGGHRLNERALTYRVGGASLAEWHELELRQALENLRRLGRLSAQGAVARDELVARLSYLTQVGLGYLSLDRQARTLSGGEAQRVTLTAALGTSLHNAMFVLDEPTVGLHPSDVAPLNAAVAQLASRGNTVIVVEHDPQMIRHADRVIELGPGAGTAGGSIVADGSPAAVCRAGGATARALRGRTVDGASRRPPKQWLRVRGARAHNLRGVDVDLPLGVVCALTGPSGSGKTTLAVDVIYRALARRLGCEDVATPGAHDSLELDEDVRRVVLVDQAALGRTSRGNAATYTKAWDMIRKRFAAEPSAQAAQLSAAHFSFNVPAGRCDACAGEGYETVEMQFLADVRLLCPVCQGKRFSDLVLGVRHRGKTIAELLEMTVDEVCQSFADEPAIVRSLGPVRRLGLGYLALGQPLSTLSGGEAQRLKIARALSEQQRQVLYVLDEPSAGLHADEVEHLLGAARDIVRAGGSVLIVDHDLDVMRGADWIVDLGPGAGAEGGHVVASGTPETIAGCATRTGDALRAQAGAKPRRRTSRSPRRASAAPSIEVVHAAEHNLQQASVTIPHGSLAVVTGPSGSGKSSLAFDVIFAEGQRRFLETLTPYARRFLPTLPRPTVEQVTGVPPSIALEQRTARAGRKSTVATVTEIAHYLRLLFAKVGQAHCPDHDQPIARTSEQSLLAALHKQRGRFDLLAPVVQARKGLYLDLFAAASRAGIRQARCDGHWVDTDSPPRLSRTHEHSIDWVVAQGVSARTLDASLVQQALQWGKGSVIARASNGRETLHSLKAACPQCGFSIPELDPRWFSFNTAQGRCAECEGEGVVERMLRRKRRRGGKRPEAPASDWVTCRACHGTRLAPIPRAVRLQGQGYAELCANSVARALSIVERWRFPSDQRPIADPVLSELVRRLQFLSEVGLDYLSLDRPAGSLSGGELQRLRLAAQLGAGLTGALYVLDEPTIGLHPSDTHKLIGNLKRLVDLGSTVLVVEHDEDVIRQADYLVDLGPAGGAAGGQVMAQGPAARVLADPRSPTARALGEARARPSPRAVARAHPRLRLEGARAHNLRSIQLELPLGRFVVVAGVSGSGKSTAVRGVLLPALRQALGATSEPPLPFDRLSGQGSLKRAIAVDQSPIGRTPRSVPATFLGIWDAIRSLFASSPEAQVAGFGKVRFSFNAAGGGRCTTCLGQGAVTHEMSFLPDVVTPCPACLGARFEPNTLSVRYMGRSIGDVLALTARQAAELFIHHPKIARPLQTLTDLGAGYITLGQGSHTLSGGEAQRLKLAAELTAGSRHESTLYVLDEPTTGLHAADVECLIEVLQRLVERGDTLVIIEHHPSVIAHADWLIELGPGGGQRGGKVVAQGPPQRLSKRATATGRLLARWYG